MDSPFNRSSKTNRSPPPQRRHEEPNPPPAPTPTAPAPTSLVPTDAVPTPELQKWMASIERDLSEICNISAEGKLNKEEKLRISAISRTIMGSVSNMAVQYQAVKQRYFSAHVKIECMTQQETFSAQLQEIKESLKAVNKQVPSTSYADMVSTGSIPVVRPSTTNSITVYPSDKDKTSEETKKLVQHLIKPENLKLQIRGLRKTRNGGVIISTETKGDLVKLRNAEQLDKSGLKIEETTMKSPKVIVIGIPSEMQESEVFECIYEQNIADKHLTITREQFLSQIKLSHKSGKKNTAVCNYIIELTGNLRRILIEQKRVYIHWTSCPVRDFTAVTRCYKCQQYGHSAKYCREADPTCGHCGHSGHSIKECPKQPEKPKCATCYRFKKPSDHKTGDVLCPARKSAEARFLSSINYEG